MFAEISDKYDVANRCISLGMDVVWRRKLAGLVSQRKPKNVADFATGSGDVAFALQKRLGPQVSVRGFDFCQPMLDIAEEKKRKRPGAEHIVFDQADCMDLSGVPGGPFDVCTISFGVRNFPDRARGFAELRGVLQDGGSLFVLEFSQPYRWLKPAYRAYLSHVLPALAGLVTRKAVAYRYLTQSVSDFPGVNQITDELRRSGFSGVNVWRLTGGIVAIHEAIR